MLLLDPCRDNRRIESTVGPAAVDISRKDIDSGEIATGRITAEINNIGYGVLSTNHISVGFASPEHQIAAGLRRAEVCA